MMNQESQGDGEFAQKGTPLKRDAQKAIVFRHNEQGQIEILFIRYAESKYTEFDGKYALPGGKKEEDESRDAALKREVSEETGVDVTPGNRVLGNISWQYMRREVLCEINAEIRVARYDSGELLSEKQEAETKLEEICWVPVDQIIELDLMPNEAPFIRDFVENISTYTSEENFIFQ